MDKDLQNTLEKFAHSDQQLTVLTGAGVSAESNIPTFRGHEGYWTIGSREYHPQEMATFRMFTEKPYEVWKWYLYRKNICQKAEPNPGHVAIAQMETLFKNRFTLITQNVDGLHIRAGNTIKRTFQIHGNISFMRCVNECASKIFPLPENLCGKEKGSDLTDDEKKLLRCQDCGSFTRPHVLWFDEAYNETYYSYQNALNTAEKTELLLIVGTSGATNLPNQVATLVHHNKGMIIDINIEPNTFTNLALSAEKGYFIKQQSSVALPSILDVFKTCKVS